RRGRPGAGDPDHGVGELRGARRREGLRVPLRLPAADDLGRNGLARQADRDRLTAKEVHMAAPRFPGRDEMAARVTRFDALREDWDLFLDNFLPGHERANLMMIGPNTGWDDERLRAPVPSEDFSLGIQKVPPGSGPALHSHRTVEVFVILSGDWVFYWNDESGDYELPLGPWDAVS